MSGGITLYGIDPTTGKPYPIQVDINGVVQIG